jgi:hypothetical protein
MSGVVFCQRKFFWGMGWLVLLTILFVGSVFTQSLDDLDADYDGGDPLEPLPQNSLAVVDLDVQEEDGAIVGTNLFWHELDSLDFNDEESNLDLDRVMVPREEVEIAVNLTGTREDIPIPEYPAVTLRTYCLILESANELASRRRIPVSPDTDTDSSSHDESSESGDDSENGSSSSESESSESESSSEMPSIMISACRKVGNSGKVKIQTVNTNANGLMKQTICVSSEANLSRRRDARGHGNGKGNNGNGNGNGNKFSCDCGCPDLGGECIKDADCMGTNGATGCSTSGKSSRVCNLYYVCAEL